MLLVVAEVAQVLLLALVDLVVALVESPLVMEIMELPIRAVVVAELKQASIQPTLVALVALVS